MDNLSDHPGQERFNVRNQIGQVRQSSFNKTSALSFTQTPHPQKKKKLEELIQLVLIVIKEYTYLKQRTAKSKEKGITQEYQI